VRLDPDVRLDHGWISSRLPHQGRMCLLDEVVHWDLQRICCRSASHRAADHPLRTHGRLGVACGIEYAAQAMAVHGALIAAGAPGAPDAPGAPGAPGVRGGLLASVRDVRFEVSRLDDVAGDLYCEATRIAGDRSTVLYEFTVRGAHTPLLSGRASIVQGAAARLAP